MKIWPFPRAKRTESKSLAEPDDQTFAVFGVPMGSVSVTAAQALSVPAVSAAIKTISEAAATLKIRILRKVGGTETDDNEHPVATLLQGDVNGWSSSFEMVRDLVAEALIKDAGALAWVNRVEGKPVEILHYKAGKISVSYEDTGEPRYTLGNKREPAENIIHLRGPFDRSPLSLAREAIGTAWQMQRYAGNFFKNGARPSGYLKLTERLGDQGMKNLRSGWDAATKGEENAGATPILVNGVEWHQLSLTSADSQFTELRRFQIEEIGRAFNIPSPMLGDLERATWSNSEQKGREFLVYTLEPWLCALEAALSRALFTADERKTYRILFDRDDLTRADLSSRAAALNIFRASEMLSADEAREWINMPPRDPAKLADYRNPNTTSNRDIENDGYQRSSVGGKTGLDGAARAAGDVRE